MVQASTSIKILPNSSLNVESLLACLSKIGSNFVAKATLEFTVLPSVTFYSWQSPCLALASYVIRSWLWMNTSDCLFQIRLFIPRVWWCTLLIPDLWNLRQASIWEFKAILVYTASCQSFRTTEWDFVYKQLYFFRVDVLHLWDVSIDVY